MWIQDSKLNFESITTMYEEDPFHFPYLIWNTLPQLCYHNGIGGI